MVYVCLSPHLVLRAHALLSRCFPLHFDIITLNQKNVQKTINKDLQLL